MKEEIWKDIDGYEGLYQISNMGRVRSLDRFVNQGKIYRFCTGSIIKPGVSEKGYNRVDLHKNGKTKHCKVHRLVAEAFIPNPDNLPIINHKDECKTNNHVDNLEWCSVSYNNTYGCRIEKKVYQYSLDGEFIKEWQSCKEVQRQLGHQPSRISECCNCKTKTAYGYIWKYAS